MYIPNSSFSLSKTKFMSYLDMKPHNRKLLQDDQDGLSPPSTYSNSRDPLNQSINGSIPFDSSMVLTILVLFTALFFMAFFSIYIRRFADNSALDGLSRRHRRRLLQPPRQSYPPPSSRFNSQKGLDPSTVRSLPLVSYGGAAEYPIDCVICLSEFEERETVKLIPYCRHVFHPTCIDTWLASHSSCPLCRSSQMFDSITTTVSEEICLGVERSNISDGVSDVSGRSTVADVDTCPEVGMRRTRIGPFEETCLGVELLSDLEGRSTVVDVDTCHEVGVTITRRRSNSWSSLGDHTVLQRSVSM